MSGQIHCANCAHCVVFLSRQKGDRRERRVRCRKDRWSHSSYMFHTVLARTVPTVLCHDYDSMGEEDKAEFLAELRQTLPVEREIWMVSRKEQVA